MPSFTKENYLKAIYFLGDKTNKVTITDLSKEMQVSKPTCNNMIKKLKENSLVKYQKYKPIELTRKGEKIATSIIRKHRLTEMFLTQVMSFGWEEVHDIAEDIEHIKSDLFFDRMDEILGFPTVDPHGSPIPDKKGKIKKSNSISLSEVKIGEQVQLQGLTNSSKELLIYLNKKNIRLGSLLTLIAIEAFDNSFEIKVDNQAKTLSISKTVYDCLLVKRC